MQVTQTEFLIICLILSIIGHAVSILMKSPKEAIRELTAAVKELREDHEDLSRRFERHDVIASGLQHALERLTARIDRLEPYIPKLPGGSRRGGQ